jgi:hypothetical protein
MELLLYGSLLLIGLFMILLARTGVRIIKGQNNIKTRLAHSRKRELEMKKLLHKILNK